MTNSALWNIQSGIFAHLAADTALAALLADGAGGIFDRVPQTAMPPYVVLSGIALRPHGTQGHGGFEALVTIDSFSRAAGLKELRQIMDAIRAALDGQAPEIEDMTVALCHETAADSRQSGDAPARGTQTFRLLLDITA